MARPAAAVDPALVEQRSLRDRPPTTIERLPTSATACPRLGTARRKLLAASRTLPRQDNSAQPGAAVTPVTGGGAVIGQHPTKPARTTTFAALPAPRATRAAVYIATQIATPIALGGVQQTGSQLISGRDIAWNVTQYGVGGKPPRRAGLFRWTTRA